jgi:hypothetical protein
MEANRMEANRMEANRMEASPPDGTELTRSARLRRAAAARGVPLPTILVTVAVLALTYLAAKLAYRLRDVLLLRGRGNGENTRYPRSRRSRAQLRPAH